MLPGRVGLLSLLALVLARPAGTQSSCSLQQLDLEGFYTDKASYAGGETISIAGNWPGRSVSYRVLRIANRGGPAAWEEVARSAAALHGAEQVPPYGSFVEFPDGPSLAGTLAFTLEGWIQPTFVGSDQVAIAGQLGAEGGLAGSSAGIGIEKSGRLIGVLKTGGVVHRILDPTPLSAGRWYYVALTYQGRTGGGLRLYRASARECMPGPRAQKSLTGSVGGTSYPFRLGARAEAPGDQTGCFDGRLDHWSVWSVPLSRAQLQQRMNEGLDPDDVLGCSTVLPPFERLELFVDFEEAYGDFVRDGSTRGRHGRIVNHGTPGMAGRPSTGRALRLNHDQVVDAAFERADPGQPAPPVVSIAVDPAWPSGFYALQALFGDEPVVGETNRAAERFQAFVVRPGAPSAAEPRRPIAVVVPVNTWMAYNSWPGAQGQERPLATAKGLTQRQRAGTCLSQGSNSVYQTLGDGVSSGHFVGWRRPNLWASPVVKTSTLVPDYAVNRRDAALDALFFEWLERPTGGLLPPGALDYDVFTDWDLHDGTLQPDRYRVLMLVGHSEYWSANMLRGLTSFLDAGGSVVSAAGNVLVWRSELSSAGGNRILEVRKWPTLPLLGQHDAVSAIAGGRTGLWRFLQACDPAGAAHDDYVLGTLGDISGGFCNQDPEHFGVWQVTASEHWLWAGAVGSGEKLVELGTVVGGEADAFVDLASLACPFPEDPPATLPALFPFSTDGQVTVLARGADFEASTPVTCGFLAVNWCHPAFEVTSAEEFDLLAGGPFFAELEQPTSEDGHGAIVTYPHVAGGQVLSLGAIDSPRALHAEIDGGNRLSALVERALACMLDPESCPR